MTVRGPVIIILLLLVVPITAAQVSLRKQADVAIDSATRLRASWKAESMRTAIKEYQRALRILEELRDVQGQSRVHLAIGEAHQALSQPTEAIASYRRSLTLNRTAKSPRAEADALNSLAYLHSLIGENTEALENSHQAKTTSIAASYVEGEAYALINFGETYYGLGELPKAVESYDLALNLLNKLDDRKGQVKALVGQGYAFVELSELEKAQAAYQQAVATSRAIADRRLEAISLRAFGNLRNLIGDKQEALTTLSLALKAIEGIDDLPAKADILGALGFLYDGLGEKDLALDYYEQALAIFRTMNHRSGIAEVQMVIAGIYYSSGDYTKALYYCQESLAMFRAMVMPRYEARMLRDIGLIHDTRGDKKRALEYFRQALAIARSGQDQRYTSQTLNYMGRTYESLKDWQAALRCYEQALALSRVASDGVGEAATLYNLAHLEAGRNHMDLALSHAEAALKISESLRTKVQSHDLRAAYFGTIHQQFNLYTEILMHLHQKRPDAGFDVMAFEANERGRARSMLEALAEARAGIRQGVDQILLRRESQLQRQLNAAVERRLQLAGAKASRLEMAALERELSELTTAYKQVQGEIRNSSPRYAALVQPTPLTLKKIQQQVLDSDTALVAFALGDERSFAWLVTTDSIKSFELDARTEIENTARRLYTDLTSRNQSQKDETPSQRRARITNADAQYLDVSRELSVKLLGDIAKDLRHKRLVIVADGALQYVPFAALPTPVGTENFRPLIADYEIVSLPSASVLALMREDLKARPRAPKSVAILADPVFEKDDERLAALRVGRDVAHAAKIKAAPLDQTQRALRDFNILSDGIARLPFSGREAKAIMALVPQGEGMLAVGFRASRATALDPELSQYRYVHFATHGFLNSKHPELSGIFLSRFNELGKSQDGFLQLHDVYNLKLSADLVVLSACQTALGKDIRGEGLVGLTRGFMYAGAPRVVASLWQVDDAATADLMREFYKEMLTRGKRPAEALRAAQVRMWEQKLWPSPYYWAAFTLQGEWR